MNRVAVIALLAGSCFSAGVASQGGARPDDDVRIVFTDLETLRRTPEAFKSIWVQFDIQFASLGRVSNPFFTRFEPSRYANFVAWAGDQPIWRRDSYDDLFGMLFVAKDTEAVSRLYDLHTYDRLRVTGVVRNTFRDQPWIEVTDFTPLSSKVDTATLAHLFRAERHMQNREWRRAISELSLAPSMDKPSFVRSAVYENLAVCHLRLGEADLARTHLQKALELNSGNRRLRDMLATATTDAQSLLDHDVDRGAIEESERPIWEAFEGGSDLAGANAGTTTGVTTTGTTTGSGTVPTVTTTPSRPQD